MILKQARERLGYSQEYVAEKLGTTQQTYQRWESKKFKIPYEKVNAASEILKISMKEIFNEYIDY